MSDTATIPTFYQVVFKYIDPFFCSLGVVMHLFDKHGVVAGLTPAATVPPAIETSLVLDYMIGFFGMLGVMQVGITFGRPKDVYLWKVLQGATFFLDVVQIASTAYHMNLQGRLTDPTNWLGGEWQNIAGNLGIGLIRAAFVMELGFGGRKTGHKKS